MEFAQQTRLVSANDEIITLGEVLLGGDRTTQQIFRWWVLTGRATATNAALNYAINGRLKPAWED